MKTKILRKGNIQNEKNMLNDLYLFLFSRYFYFLYYWGLLFSEVRNQVNSVYLRKIVHFPFKFLFPLVCKSCQ